MASIMEVVQRLQALGYICLLTTIKSWTNNKVVILPPFVSHAKTQTLRFSNYVSLSGRGHGPKGIMLLVFPYSFFTRLIRSLIAFHKDISKTARSCLGVRARGRLTVLNASFQVPPNIIKIPQGDVKQNIAIFSLGWDKLYKVWMCAGGLCTAANKVISTKAY